MGNRVRISNESLNSYGTRILTSGMDIEQYRRNPVVLYMHERGLVIGYMKNLEVTDDELTGELVFDEASELSVRCKKQWAIGSLKMVSAGLDIKETSEDPKYLVEGQTCPTITKSKLYEVSVVDIGANDDALRLERNGKQITMGRDSEFPLPLLTNNKKHKKMETKEIALMLGLPETATDADVKSVLCELKSVKDQNEVLEKELASLKLSRIESSVDKAVQENRLSGDEKDHFIELGKKVGCEELDKILNAMSPRVKLSQVLGHQGGAPTGSSVTYNKLSEVPADKILELREKNREEYARLYKAEYGMDCEI